MYGSVLKAFRYASFQVATIITTTGFMTTDYNLWPSFSKAILLSLMVIGACAGSTGGGMKMTTFFVLVTTSMAIFRNRSRTESFGRTIPETVVRNATTILMLYISLCVGAAMIISALRMFQW